MEKSRNNSENREIDSGFDFTIFFLLFVKLFLYFEIISNYHSIQGDKYKHKRLDNLAKCHELIYMQVLTSIWISLNVCQLNQISSI